MSLSNERTTDMQPLDTLRKDIDRIDRAFIQLLAERMEAVRSIGAFKRDNPEAPLRDDQRERSVFEFWAQEGERAGLSEYFVGRILREVLNYSRRDQERFLDRFEPKPGSRTVRVGYQGAPASYSELTIDKLFASRSADPRRSIGFHTFGAVIDALEAGEVEYALLPIENTIAGSINEVYQLLANHKVHVVDEEVWPVEHCLVGLPGTQAKDVCVIRSHPVALQQCHRFLDAMVGSVSESYYDTAGACASVAEGGDPTVAAIAAEEAARRYGLEVLQRDVSDERVNMTRFVLVALQPEPVDARQPAKTSLILTVHHRQGALAECLQAFAREGINLTKLESRPRSEAPWEYLFYVDVEGNVEDPHLQQALSEVRGATNHLRVLGCYPRRSGNDQDAPAPRRQRVAKAAPAATCAPEAPAIKVNKNLKLCSLNGTGRSTIRVGNVEIGGDRFALIAGPCAVETESQIHAAAALVKKGGAVMLRGGAFKPRSSPYSFQGLGFPGLDLLAEAGRAYEMPIVTEVLRIEDVERIAEKADVLQIGARNMQNFALLKEVGRTHRPVLLKRGMSATIEELLLAAEYIMSAGNQRVILCERGIRTFETATRNTLDLSAIPVLKARTHLPVIVDPSHAAGVRYLVVPMSLAAAAAGADGLIVEVHPNPAEALCDKEQALTAEDLDALVHGLRPIVEAQGRTL